MKVLISDNFSQQGLEVLAAVDSIEVDYCPGVTAEQLRQRITSADALVVRGGTAVTAELLADAPKLKIIARAGIGLGNIDMNAATRHGIVVTNTPTGSTTTIAEHAIAMLLASARMIPQAYNSVRRGEWSSAPFRGAELRGKTLGVIGGGKIGRLVIEYARGLHMQVNLYDPYLSENIIQRLGACKVSFDELLTSADFISLHIPLNIETEQLLDAKAFARMKPGCRLINCALGGLVNETDMIAALQNGTLAAAALDTFATEPPTPDNPLLHMDNVIYTPHLRAATVDAQVNVTVQAARQVIDFLTTGVVHNSLNIPAISAELLESLRPYLRLGEGMGSFLAQQLNKQPFSNIAVNYCGEVLELQSTQPITLAILKGLLTPILGDRVNYVNAPHLARERGISVTETRRNVAEGFSNMIELRVSGAQGERSVRGAMFNNNEGRIIAVDGYSVEATPQGTILVVTNRDRPGVIALLGTLLAQANVNVAMMNLSRAQLNGTAMSLLTVDHRVPEATLEQLRRDDNILAAIQVELPTY